MKAHSQITGLYTEVGDIELRGNRAALRHLAEFISEDASSSILILSIPRNEHIFPYGNVLTAIYITHNNKPVSISRSGSELRIAGSKEKLKVLSENIIWLSNNSELGGDSEDHLHIEYLPEHYYLAESSLPIVVTLE